MTKRYSRRGIIKGATTAGAGLLATPMLAMPNIAHAAEPLKIGSGYPLTNYAASDGQAMTNGSLLAIEEINARGGVNGRELKQVVLDLENDKNESVTNVLSRLIDEKVDAFAMGYYTASQIGADIAASYGKPLLNMQADQGQIDLLSADPEKYHMVFPMDTAETSYGSAFIPFLDNLEKSGAWKPSARTIMPVRGDSVYSQGIGDALAATAKGSSWEIVNPQDVIAPVNDWGAVLNNVRSQQPGVIFVTHWSPPELAVFVRQFVASPTNSLVYLQYGPSVPEFLDLTGDSANGFVWATNTGILPDVIGQRFVERYKARFNEDPGASIAGLAYDQIHLLARAWQEVPDVNDGRAVSAAIRRIVYRGINGGYWFDSFVYPRGYPAEVQDPSIGIPHLFFQIQEKQHKLIAPAPYYTDAFKLAPWQS